VATAGRTDRIDDAGLGVDAGLGLKQVSNPF
jgi:hypothetical protein